MRLYCLLLILFFVSCATRTPVADRLTRKNPAPVEISHVPVIPQKDYHCGPAALATVMQFQGKSITAEEAAGELFHKKLKGSFFTEMKGRARREGFLALEVNDLESAFAEIRDGNPIIILENNGFRFFPQWHFSVLTGIRPEGPDVVLHRGDKTSEVRDMRMFERAFILGGKRALLLLPPGKMSTTVSEKNHVDEAVLLESLGKIPEARDTYLSILKRWPGNVVARLGASNTHYALKEKDKALQVLREIPQENALILHNTAIIQSELGFITIARKTAQRAMELAGKEESERLRQSLADLL